MIKHLVKTMGLHMYAHTMNKRPITHYVSYMEDCICHHVHSESCHEDQVTPHPVLQHLSLRHHSVHEASHHRPLNMLLGTMDIVFET